MRVSIVGVGALWCVCAVAEVASAHHPLINEFVANHEGDDTHEFFEVFFQPETDLSVFTLIAIEGDRSENPGEIDAAFQLGTTDHEGIWWTDFLDNELEDGSVTYLLVLRFTGKVGLDLDENNDGVIDVVLWDWVSDQLGVFDGGEEDLNYTGVVMGIETRPGPSPVGGASRIPNGYNSYSVSDFRRNAFNGEGIPKLPGGRVHFREALNTPGEINETRLPPPPVIRP